MSIRTLLHSFVSSRIITSSISILVLMNYFHRNSYILFYCFIKKNSKKTMSEKFCLKWNDFETNVSKSFGLLRSEDFLHDVTLVSDDN